MTSGNDLTDKTGARVTIADVAANPISAFTISLDGVDAPVGKAEYVDSSTDVRIFFHTEVDPAYGGRGLAGLLVKAALDESISNGRTVIPVCPLFAGHLDKHGEAFVAAGGVFRKPTTDDIAAVKSAIAQR